MSFFKKLGKKIKKYQAEAPQRRKAALERTKANTVMWKARAAEAKAKASYDKYKPKQSFGGFALPEEPKKEIGIKPMKIGYK